MGERLGPVGEAPASVGERKLTRDIAYTLVSFAVLAASGMAINLIITGFRDAAALGVFNQSYAVYVMASQLATFGLHYSVLRHTALHEGDASERGRVLLTAAICALTGGFVASGVTFAAAPLIGRAFDSHATGEAVRYAAFGLTLFPLNKVLLAHLNALRHMRAYSLLQIVRYLSIMSLVAFFSISSMPIERATLAFAVAELITAAAAVLYLWRQQEFYRAAFSRSWVRSHVSFGGRGLVAGMFAEFNSRVDVLLIGIFMSDRLVGIYSFAAMLADGLYNVLAMVRLNLNPLLVRAVRDEDRDQPERLLAKSRKYVTPAAASLSLLLIVAFWVLAQHLMPQKGLIEGLPPLMILLGVLSLVSSLVPFDNLLLVTGHPGYQTLQQAVTVGANVVFGLLLLLPFGIIGVAVGTAISYVVSIGALVFMANRILHWNLLTNSYRE